MDLSPHDRAGVVIFLMVNILHQSQRSVTPLQNHCTGFISEASLCLEARALQTLTWTSCDPKSVVPLYPHLRSNVRLLCRYECHAAVPSTHIMSHLESCMQKLATSGTPCTLITTVFPITNCHTLLCSLSKCHIARCKGIFTHTQSGALPRGLDYL